MGEIATRNGSPHMNSDEKADKPPKGNRFILALHSSSEVFGVGIIDLKESNQYFKSSTFNIGRKLSNCIIECIETILPASRWEEINRIAVATGPGGFTSTRLGVAFGRTLAQQIKCPLHGVSSYLIMSQRLCKLLNESDQKKPFWITQELKRRGVIAGQYIVNNGIEAQEIYRPKLLQKGVEINPCVAAEDNVEKDIISLLKIALNAKEKSLEGKWEEIVPIYPTSPVDNIK